MNKVTFRSKEYPVRTFEVIIDGEEETIVIATESLSEAMLNDDGDTYDNEGYNLDNEIYFYVSDEIINLDASKICEEHLDEPMEFVKEVN